jgi:LacI family transcriptional regulator
MSDARRTTITHVAAHAGVDRSVVSRVLSGDPRLNVRDETRARVLAAVRELDYRPNAIARSLRTQRAEAFGLSIPDFANPIYSEVITGAAAAAAERDCLLLTTSEAQIRRPEQHLDLLEQGRVDGLLLAGAVARPKMLARLSETRRPWLLINRRVRGSRRWIVLDDEQAAFMAVAHLASLGHERIAHLAGPPEADTAQRRLRGYRRALAEHDLPEHEALVVRSDYSADGGAQAMTELIRARPRPTAVFAANVAAAIGALATAREAGVDVPGRLSVIAVHDTPLAGYLAPPLTTLRMPLEELGRRAIAVLADVAPDAEVKEVLGGRIELIPRASTGPVSGR